MILLFCSGINFAVGLFYVVIAFTSSPSSAVVVGIGLAYNTLHLLVSNSALNAYSEENPDSFWWIVWFYRVHMILVSIPVGYEVLLLNKPGNMIEVLRLGNTGPLIYHIFMENDTVKNTAVAILGFILPGYMLISSMIL